MAAEQIRDQVHVGPREMRPETRSALDPDQGRPAADGFPLNGPTVLTRQNLG